MQKSVEQIFEILILKFLATQQWSCLGWQASSSWSYRVLCVEAPLLTVYVNNIHKTVTSLMHIQPAKTSHFLKTALKW